MFPRYSEPYKEQNTVQNNSGGLLPNLVIVPSDAPRQFEETLQDAGRTIGNLLQGQAIQNLGTLAATGKTPMDWVKIFGSKMLNNPAVANGIVAIGATRFGAPVVNGVRNFANSSAGKKFFNLGDWFF